MSASSRRLLLLCGPRAREVEGREFTLHTPDEWPGREAVVVGGAPGESVSGLGLPIPGEPPQLPACFPAGNGRSRARLRGLPLRVSAAVGRWCSGFPAAPPVFHPSLPAAPGTSAAGISGAGGGERLQLGTPPSAVSADMRVMVVVLLEHTAI
ncbi:unnamed protein product [Pleuronectes platessa]|uniref:Uncharacterized protein n=1 Tax=Pleuronectes platessa TaxID=8262 RepID=A0A9N7TWY3_PLEPL|nr:unnamed protein product [Pleuronectes platessa]